MSKVDISILVRELEDWIKDYFADNGPDCKAVIGISGGKDSSVAAALLTKTLGKDRVLGVLMPQGEQKDIKDSHDLVEHLDIDSIEVNIGHTCDGLITTIGNNFNRDLNSQVTINLPARIRMTTLYAVAAQVGGRVVNTCNLSEDYVGYSTKFGDSAGDFSLFANLTSEEVIKIGKYLGLPDHLTKKAPSDGLSGLSDEENLGFSYNILNAYIRDRVYPDYDTLKTIKEKHNHNLHKVRSMPIFCPSRKAIPEGRINDFMYGGIYEF